MNIIILYSSLICAFTIYSYSLIDPNITFFNHTLWERFRNIMVNFGYYQRPISSLIFIFFITLLWFSHYYFVKKYRVYNPLTLSLIVGFTLLFSYPFLSHDFFNYMFDARIITMYHSNPYTHKALDFPTDQWLRFMHWTHRTYPYGPFFLILSLIPSLLSFGKFILNFLFFKLMFFFFYIIAVHAVTTNSKKMGMFFATNPLLIVEGIVNAHNDLIALSLALMGIIILKKHIIGRLFLLLSGGIKYFTLPLLFVSKKINILTISSLFVMTLGILYISIKHEIQPWYFLNFFVLVFYFPSILNKSILFQYGLIAAYYPYIRYDGWASQNSIEIKHIIIFLFLVLNCFFLAFKKIIPSKRFG